MRLITWNCQGAFREKADGILELGPDLLCVQEMEQPSKIDFSAHAMLPNNVIWDGENTNKGLGVLSYNKAYLAATEKYNVEYRHLLPVICTCFGLSFPVVNVWTKSGKKGEYPYREYIDYVIDGLPYYERLGYKMAIFAGDFNADMIVTTGGRFEKAVDMFAGYGLHSSYHQNYGCEFSSEKDPTSFFLRNPSKPFHIDYVFCSGYWLENLQAVTVGKPDEWLSFSDHMPIIVDFKLAT